METALSEFRSQLLELVAFKRKHFEKRIAEVQKQRNPQFWLDYLNDKMEELNRLEKDIHVRL